MRTHVDLSIEIDTYPEEALERGAAAWNHHDPDAPDPTVSVGVLVGKIKHIADEFDIDNEAEFMAASWLYMSDAVAKTGEIERKFKPLLEKLDG